MSSVLADALADLPALLREHLAVSLSAILLAVLIGLPLALVASRSRAVRVPVLGTVGLIQTIPALALLALFYPLLLLLGRGTGLGLPALGFLPALLALTLYALLPIVRNGVAALRGIDPSVLEAADGIGMTRGQRLRIVELPLGAPVIIAGIRTASVWTIGAATLSTTVGQPSMGDLIFSGLQTENWTRVLVGCAGAAGLALIADFILAVIENGLAKRSKSRVRAGLALVAAALAIAFIPWRAAEPDRPTIVIGAKNFSEQYVLASAIEQKLQAAGYRTERRDGLGSTVAYTALAAGDIDVYVDYSGTLWANILERTDVLPPRELRRQLTEALKARDGVTVLGALGFENAYALAMKRSDAERLRVTSLEDLAREAPRLRFAADLEFLTRPEWRAVADTYRIRFAGQRSYSPTFMYRAIADGSADVISAFSSDGRIADLDLVTLSDPRSALPSYDAVMLVAPDHAGDTRLLDTLRPFVGAITVERMREANFMVDRDTDKKSPAEAARWLMESR